MPRAVEAPDDEVVRVGARIEVRRREVERGVVVGERRRADRRERPRPVGRRAGVDTGVGDVGVIRARRLARQVERRTHTVRDHRHRRVVRGIADVERARRRTAASASGVRRRLPSTQTPDAALAPVIELLAPTTARMWLPVCRTPVPKPSLPASADVRSRSTRARRIHDVEGPFVPIDVVPLTVIVCARRAAERRPPAFRWPAGS